MASVDIGAAMAATKRAKKATRKTARKTTLTKKQVAQRKYAASMKGIRKRAKTAKRGTGLIKKRTAATTLRRKLGLKA